MQGRKGERFHGDFIFRVKIGEYEVELGGNRDEVLKTIGDLPSLMSNVRKAFDTAKPSKVVALTVKTGGQKEQKVASQKYPRVLASEDYDETVLRLLETDWGKWRPRTLEELREAFMANGMDYSARTLAAVLTGLVKKERIRRWKTDAGDVYILAEKEVLGLGGEHNGQD